MEHLLVSPTIKLNKKPNNNPPGQSDAERCKLSMQKQRQRELNFVKVRVDHKTEILVTPARANKIQAEWDNLQREKKLSHNFHTMAKK